MQIWGEAEFYCEPKKKFARVEWYGMLGDIYIYIYIYIYICVCVCVCLFTQHLCLKQNFWAEFNRFEFRVFLFLDWLTYKSYRAHSTLLFTHRWRENSWIHTFLKDISAMWNTNSLFKNLNSGYNVCFLQR